MTAEAPSPRPVTRKPLRSARRGSSVRPVARMLFGLEATEQDERGVRNLLRRRLLLILILMLVMVAAWSVNVVINFRMVTSSVWWISSVVSGGILTSLGSVWLLWRRPQLSMATLRTVELITFAFLTAGLVSITVSWFEPATRRAIPLPLGTMEFWGKRPWRLYENGGTYFARATFGIAGPVIVNFGLLSTFYGVFIPNTWRRCLIVLIAISLIAELCVAQAMWPSPALRPQLGACMWLIIYLVGMFGAIALYGCHKLTVLRQVEREAREVGQYLLGDPLGRGGLGEVYRARHRMLRRPCAVKLIRADQAGSAEALLRFEREVQAMATLTHPNTVEIYDYGRTQDGTLYYAMEYLPGMTLDALVHQHGPLSPARAVYLLRQICRALREAHDAGLIHREPNNR